jgi:hypothetical protein
MKTGQFLNFRVLPTISAMLLGVGLLLLAAPDRIQADSTATYNFSGTLLQAVNGNASVTGQFTLDLTNPAVTAFDFTTPVETISSSGTSPVWTPTLYTFTALNPNLNFVDLVFIPGSLNPPDAFILIFQTTLSAFDPSTFYTGVVTLPGGPTYSVLDCEHGCNGYGSTFVIPTPEPSSLLVLGYGLLGLAPLLRLRFNRRSA